MKTIAALALAALLAWSTPAFAQTMAQTATAGSIYLPAYSHIPIGDRAQPYLLAITVSLRNLSPSEPVVVDSADYFDTEGGLITKYLDAPRTIAPLGTLVLTVPESEKRGGAGAKFLIAWRSARPVAPPLAESVMVGVLGQQGVSFTSRGIDLVPRR